MGLPAPKPTGLLVALALAGASSALLAACVGSGPNREDMRFDAERIAVTSTGTPFVAGLRGCVLVIARVGSGEPRQVRVGGEELGGDCVKGITAMQGSRAGVDVNVDVDRFSDSAFEDTSGKTSALVRVTPTGERDSRFGKDGVVEEVGPVATLPDGRVFDPGGRIQPSGERLRVRPLPVDFAYEQVIAAGPDGKLVLAGQPRFGKRDHVQVVKLTTDLRLDRGFGRGGVARLPYGFPERIEPLPDGGAMVIYAGRKSLAAVDGRGRPLRALTFGARQSLAIAGGSTGVALAQRGRIELLPTGPSAPTTIRSPGNRVADLALAPGRLLVLGKNMVTAFDREGHRVGSWPVG